MLHPWCDYFRPEGAVQWLAGDHQFAGLAEQRARPVGCDCADTTWSTEGEDTNIPPARTASQATHKMSWYINRVYVKIKICKYVFVMVTKL